MSASVSASVVRCLGWLLLALVEAYTSSIDLSLHVCRHIKAPRQGATTALHPCPLVRARGQPWVAVRCAQVNNQ